MNETNTDIPTSSASSPNNRNTDYNEYTSVFESVIMHYIKIYLFFVSATITANPVSSTWYPPYTSITSGPDNYNYSE